jgi:hypothetical protein
MQVFKRGITLDVLIIYYSINLHSFHAVRSQFSCDSYKIFRSFVLPLQDIHEFHMVLTIFSRV